MHRLIFFIIALGFTTSSFSQSDFRKGFIITSSKDTVFGLIDYREGSKPYKSCAFKKTEGESTTTYDPNEIRGYGFIEGKYFESREIKEENQIQKVIFIEVKIKGVVSLYKFDNSFLVEKTGDTLTRLYNKIEERLIDTKIVQWNTNEHVVKLNWLLFDCVDLRERIQKIRLIERELISLIEDYNQCTGKPAITYNASKPWMKLEMGMVGGLNISNLEFATSADKFKHLKGSFDVSKSPVIGLSFDILSPRLSERFSFHGDVLYIKSKYENVNIFTSYYSTERDYVTIELHQLKIPVGVRYTFPEKKITPYFNMGISTTLNLKSGSTWIQELEGNFNDVFIRHDKDQALPIKGNQLGFWGGLGAIKSITKKLRAFVEVRYEQTNGTSYMSYRDEDLRSKIQNFQITLGIRK
jgi:hypothetical protein